MPNFLVEHWSGKINEITNALYKKLNTANIPNLKTVDPEEVRAFVLRKLMKQIKADAEQQLKREPQFFRFSDRQVMYGIADKLFQEKNTEQLAQAFVVEIQKDSKEFLEHREFNQCWPMGEKVQNDNKLFRVNHSEVSPMDTDARKVSNKQLKTWLTDNGHSRVDLKFSAGNGYPDVVREELADIVESSTSTTEAENRLKTLRQSLNIMAELPKAAPSHVKNVPMSWKDFMTLIESRYNIKYNQESGMSYQTAENEWKETLTTKATKNHHVLSVIKPIVEGIPPESKENKKREECLQRVIVFANATYDYAGVPRYTYNSKGNVLPEDAAKELQECLLNGVKVPLLERYHVSTDEKLTHSLMKNQTFQKDYYLNASSFFSTRIKNQKSKPTQQTGQGNRKSYKPELQRAFCEALRQYRESLPADVKDDLGKLKENVIKNLKAIICNARDILTRQNNVNARKFCFRRTRRENNQPMVQNDQNEILLNEVNEDENMEMLPPPFIDNFDTQSVVDNMSILNGDLYFGESNLLPAVMHNNAPSDGNQKEAEGGKDNRTLWNWEDGKLNKIDSFITKKRYPNELNFTNLYDAENNTFTGFKRNNDGNTKGNPFM